MSRKLASSRRKLWVVKAGSQIICTGGPLLIRSWMQQIAHLKKSQGIDVVWVTSGAIASAIDRTGVLKPKKSGRRNLVAKQALSAIGQPLVMDLYSLALQVNGLLGAQILLTYDDLIPSGATDRAGLKRRENFKKTLKQLIEWGVTPILNENDAVATEEIQFGDNDRLSAIVAKTIKADQLVILTDVDGLYERDPTKDPSARLIERVDRVDSSILKKANGRSSSGRGRGGMLSKLMAAKEASSAGICTWLVKGDRPTALVDIAMGHTRGTFFPGASQKSVAGKRRE